MFQVLNDVSRRPWNKGKLVGPKPPLTLQQVWEIRIRLQILNRTRDLTEHTDI
jgi:hypothetical protein